MQEVLGYSPLKAALAWAPGAVLFLLLAPLVQGAIQKVGPRAVYLAGTVVWAITVSRSPATMASMTARRRASALVAEADGNRTRQRRGTPLTGFEDQGDHQEPRRLRAQLY
jgi:hypothetical protein